MNRSQLEHILRAAGDISEDDEIVVLGSTSLLAQFPNASPDLLYSMEADIFPKNKPEMAQVIDGCIGELSPFHQTFGYYAHGIGPETAKNLPKGWEQRLIPLQSPNTRGITGWCLDIHDLVLGKYVSGREKDLAFNSQIINQGLVSQKILLERIKFLEVPELVKDQINRKIKADTGG
ncbi:MAG: hypothetical protein HY879_14680 [Deltaproteobacteria bacterium]|nr:hypothetical protein [Deltaproteobacteria bacterium]